MKKTRHFSPAIAVLLPLLLAASLYFVLRPFKVRAAVVQVTTAADAGAGSLRAAISAANNTPGADLITFNIPGAGPHTINLQTALPSITDTLTIDATTQPGFAGLPLVELNGSAVGTNPDGGGLSGLVLVASGSVVRGLAINRFSGDGITLIGSNNLIEGNFIGTDPSGLVALGNGGRGVLVQPGSNGNTIGGPGAPARNVISGNGLQGVRILGGATGNRVQGNFIGVNAAGSAALGNTFEGVFLSSADNTVGGAEPGAGNLISGNGSAGLAITGTGAFANVVQGNRIGTNASGLAALPNAFDGVLIDTGASGNLIGGSTPAAANLISGNLRQGVLINGGANNVVAGNRIGTDANGVLPLGNRDGVVVDQSFDNQIFGNVIAFSTGGELTAGDGVRVLTGTGNRISANSIFENAGLGIDLGGDGPTPNDPCDADDGANELQNAPVLTSVVRSGASLIVRGSLNSAPDETFTIEFFGARACDAPGLTQGEVFLGSGSVTTGPDCTATFQITLPADSLPGGAVVATATQATDFENSNTSEFSNCVALAIDLAVAGAVTPETVVTGAGLTQTITVVNRGSSAAEFVVVTAALPAGLTLLSCSATRGTCSLSEDGLTVVFDLLAAGQSETITLAANAGCEVADGAPLATRVLVQPAIGESVLFNNQTTLVAVAANPAPVIACSADITAAADPERCAAVVAYAQATAEDNCPGARVICSPPSGSVFPVGDTTVVCTATDSGGRQSVCRFLVRVEAPPGASIDPAAVAFAEVSLRRKAKKNTAAEEFSVENAGCAPLVFTFASLSRTGAEVEDGRISNADDRPLFQLRAINAGGSETPVLIGEGGTQFVIPPGGRRTFRILFRPALPAVVDRTSDLPARLVIPDVVRSVLVVAGASSALLEVRLTGRVRGDAKLINPTDPARPPVILFSREDDELTVESSIHDPNLDLSQIVYQFLDAGGQPVGEAIAVDMRPAIQESGLVRGQSFTVAQRFRGARTRPEIAGVRVTLVDANSTSTGSSSRRLSSGPAGVPARARRGIIEPPPQWVGTISAPGLYKGTTLLLADRSAGRLAHTLVNPQRRDGL